MIDLSQKHYISIALALLVLALFSWQSFTQNNQSRGPDQYGQYRLVYTGEGWFYPYPAQAYLKGTSCRNLKGSIFSGTKEPTQNRLEYNGTFICIPHVDNIPYHLENTLIEAINTSKIAKSSGNQIIFNNGLLLIALAPDEQNTSLPSKPNKVSSKSRYVIDIGKDTNNAYIEVTHSQKCTQDSDLFCIVTRFYQINDEQDLSNNILLNKIELYEKRYYLFCWECKKLKKSIQSIQDNILFSQNSGDILVFDGGYAIAYLTSSSKYGVKELSNTQKMYYLNRIVKMRKLIN